MSSRLLRLWCLLAPLAFASNGAPTSSQPTASDPIPLGVRQQVEWLSATLDEQDAAANQQQFPEGELFTWEFYGLALLNIAETSRQSADVERAATQVRALLPRLDRLLNHQPFAPMAHWPLRGGICWFSGQALVRARLVALLGAKATAQEVRRFHDDSATLATAFAASKTGVLEAHPGLSWPVDSLFGLESLKVHDALYGTNYFEPAFAKHRRALERVMDPTLGLPASFVHLDGRPRDVPRGCALSWSLSVLPRLDRELAARLWANYQRHFFSCSGVPCLVREYPPGVDRAADVDSGPIIGGYGVSATGFALAAARANGELEVARRLEETGEMFGAPSVGPQGKHYLGGAMPMVDVLSLYVRTVPVGPQR